MALKRLSVPSDVQCPQRFQDTIYLTQDWRIRVPSFGSSFQSNGTPPAAGCRWLMAVERTTGAGDATIAGFLSGLLRDMPPEEALTAAVAVGGCNVETADALSGVRPWEETLRRVAGGWARHRLQIKAPGWRFDDGHHLWVGVGKGAARL